LAESLGLIAKRKAKSGAAARASVAEESEYAVGGSASGAGRELQLSDLTQPLGMCPVRVYLVDTSCLIVTPCPAASSKLLSTSTSTLIKHAQSNKASVPLLGASKAAVIRQEQYEVTKAEVTRWQPEVKKNREASSLSFPLRSQPAPHVSTKTLTADLNPTSSLEADIASLLKGAGEENVQAFEALAMNNMSPEDVRARQAELAKMRSLLFFHEIKCRRIARIKSKKFAKVHKKKKGAAGSNADDDDVNFEEGGDSEAADKRERARIKERMTLKHRNTSKWVTRQLHRGGGKEKGTRQAIEQQLRLAEDLKRKVERLSGSSDDGADGVSGEDEGVDSLREGIENHESDVQHKGLHGMAFMKRARDKGKAQALKLLDEIAAADAGEEAASDDNNAQHGSGRRSFNISAPARQQAASMNTENRSGFHDDDDDDDNSGAQFGADQTRANANAGRKRANAESSSSSSGPPVQLQGGKGLQTLHASLGGSTSLTSTGAVTVVPATASAISNSSRSSRSASRASVSSKTDIGAAVATLPQDNKSEDAASSSAVSSRKKLQRQDNDSNPESFALHNTSNALSNPWLTQPSAAPVSSRGRGDGDQRAAANVLQPMPSADFVREKSNDETAADIEEAFAWAPSRYVALPPMMFMS
jgi:U3 small nucleolar RNA-associated protein 14